MLRILGIILVTVGITFGYVYIAQPDFCQKIALKSQPEIASGKEVKGNDKEIAKKKTLKEGGSNPTTFEELTVDNFATLVWREGAHAKYGHILYPNRPLVDDDVAEMAGHFFAPVLGKYYTLSQELKTKSGRPAWVLIPKKPSFTVPKEVVKELGRYYAAPTKPSVEEGLKNN